MDQLSPSKTRQRTAQAHQLNTLTLWLANLISSSHPQSQSQLTDPNSNPDSLPPHLSHWRSETTSHPDGPSILAALQTLRATNLRANEIQNLAFEAAREELGILQQQHNDREQGLAPARQLLEMIREALNPDAREKLTQLARAGVVLGLQPNTSFELGEDGQSQRGTERETERENETLETRFTRAVVAQSSQLIELHRQIAVSDCLRAQINQQTQTQTRTQPRQNAIPHGKQAGLSSSAASTNPHPHPQTHTSSPNNSTTISISISNDDDDDDDDEGIHQATTHLNQATKPLALKTNEYRARIHALQRQLHHLRPSSTPASKTASRHAHPDTNANINSNTKLNEPVEIDNAIDNLTQLHRSTEDRRIRVRVLENQIEALGGLPPDLEVARAEVRRAQRELEMWRGRREEVFGLVGGG